MLVLLVTGVILFVWYRPETADVWVERFGLDEGHDELTRTASAVHAGAAWAALPLAVAAGVLTAIPHLRRGLTLGIGLVVVLLFGLFSGALLPWDLLAMRSVTVGSEAKGYRLPLAADQVRFVIIDGREVAQVTFARVIVHTVVVGLALAGLLALAWRRGPGGPGGAGGRRQPEARTQSSWPPVSAGTTPRPGSRSTPVGWVERAPCGKATGAQAWPVSMRRTLPSTTVKCQVVRISPQVSLR